MVAGVGAEGASECVFLSLRVISGLLRVVGLGFPTAWCPPDSHAA